MSSAYNFIFESPRLVGIKMTVKEMVLKRGWKILKFSECIEHINTGLNPRKNFTLGTGDIKYITAKNLTKFGTVDFSKCDFIDERAKSIIHRRSNIKVGDILFSSRAPIGHCHLIKNEPNDFDIGESIFAIRVNREVVLPAYMCLYLASDYYVEAASLHTTGSIIVEIRIGDLMNTEIIVPPMEIQKKIADCLERIDRNLELNRMINDNLQHQLKLMYDYWFTQFDFPDENGKPYRASGGAMVWNEQLRKEIPKDWSVTTVGDITVCHDSKRIPVSNVEREKMKGNIPYYGATGIMGYVNRAIFSGDYVLLAEDGSVMDKNGNPIIQRVSGDVWINNHAHVLQPTGKYSCRLLMMILKDIPVTNIKTGSIQLKINQKNLNSYKILNIPNNIIEKINQVFIPIDQQLIAIQKEVEYLSALRDWLLPMLMNGQATISD